FEKRPAYTRERKVTLGHFLLAESVADYDAEDLDADDIRAVFRHDDLADLIASKEAIPEEIRELIAGIGTSFVALNSIEMALAEIVGAGRAIDRRQQALTLNELDQLVRPGDTVLDATGRNSLTRDALLGADNTLEFVLEHALVASFAFDGDHACDEQCKRSGSIGNEVYDFIPSVRRSHAIADRSVVVGIVEISDEDFARLPRTLDAPWLALGDPVAQGINRFLDHHRTLGTAAPAVLDVMTLPLNLYCAQHFTNAHHRRVGEVPDVSVYLLGDAAIGSPYFQSISLGLESAFYLAAQLRQFDSGDPAVLARYERFMERQWMRVYMRSRAIKVNKDVLSMADDIPRLLDRLYVF
ncbi:MAG: hypothetical protein ACKN9D_19085, partial [Actinomycetales bacterium]